MLQTRFVDAGWNRLRFTLRALVEIESAAAALSPGEKAELLVFVARQLRHEQTPLPEPRLFTPEQLLGWMDEVEEDLRRFRAGA